MSLVYIVPRVPAWVFLLLNTAFLKGCKVVQAIERHERLKSLDSMPSGYAPHNS